ncbi:hypothetical protein [Sediminicoccus sp. KRV36]|uniref:hypothetical protein n=1 Tax=Sediminicoccus sp. KRV36 TaxID=3133721 RepID=UPI00200F33E2|nr:hypothetical protein [Sediminicoccus rosea]UPY37052.1 hypothetical protein LHU95_23020 [Sediminicoccus rosea]
MRATWIVMASLICVLTAPVLRAQPGPDAFSAAFPALRVLDVARAIELDSSAAEVMDHLTAVPWLSIEEPRPLPNGVSQLIVAVPEDEDCMPRGAAMVCSSIRVVLMNDPQRGMRVSRVEAFETLDSTRTVSEVFSNAARGLGPPLQTESWGDQIRGLPRSVWRQRWRPDASEGTFMEVIVTAVQPPELALGLPDPSSPAAGVGFVLVDPQLEDSTMMARRRSICQPGVPGCS